MSVASVCTVPPTAGGSSSMSRDSVAQRPDTLGQPTRALFDRGYHPSSLRVPGGPSAEHANGATGISRLKIAAPDVKAAVGSFAIYLRAVSQYLSGWVLHALPDGTAGRGEMPTRRRGPRPAGDGTRDRHIGRCKRAASATIPRDPPPAPTAGRGGLNIGGYRKQTSRT
jgi:hypothetical protein